MRTGGMSEKFKENLTNPISKSDKGGGEKNSFRSQEGG